MGRKVTIFALFYFVFEGKFQVQAARGAYIRRDDLTGGFLGYDFGGAYIWRGLFSEFYGKMKPSRVSFFESTRKKNFQVKFRPRLQISRFLLPISRLRFRQ